MEENKYIILKNLVLSLEEDYNKFFQKGNKTAGTRVRQELQSIKSIAQDIRKDISDLKRNIL